jgi:membrane fusion protein (multidrug efflux system)
MSRQTKQRLTAVFGGTLALVVLASVFFLLRSDDAGAVTDVTADLVSETDTPKVPVEVSEILVGSISSTLTSSSTIEAEQSAQVLAKVEGILTAVKVREGENVQADQKLACLEDEEKTLALEKARLRLGKAKAEYKRAQLSFDQKLISRFDYEKSVFDRDLAESELETSILELDYTQVRAPFSGRITQKAGVVGQAVKKGDHLFTVADFGSLVARIFLPEKDVFQLKKGQTAELVLESKADLEFNGRIRDISPVVDPRTGTVKVTVDITSRGTTLRPGAFVRVNIITDTHEQAALIPKIALLKEDSEDFVYLAIEDVAVRRPVRTGYISNGMVEIIEGVGPGDRIVVAGHTALKDDSPLEVLKD